MYYLVRLQFKNFAFKIVFKGFVLAHSLLLFLVIKKNRMLLHLLSSIGTHAYSPALGRLKQENHFESKASLGFIMNEFETKLEPYSEAQPPNNKTKIKKKKFETSVHSGYLSWLFILILKSFLKCT